MDPIKWSILVLTLPSRVDTFFLSIIKDLQRQVAPYPDIEVLALYDNKKMTVGEKRNILLNGARGEYISFVDDDDELSGDYVSEIYKHLHYPIDVVIHLAEVTSDGQCRKTAYFDLENKERIHVNDDTWKGPPSHTMAWRRELALRVKFPEISLFEDSQWSDAVCGIAKTQIKIDKILYYYKFSNTTSETRLR